MRRGILIFNAREVRKSLEAFVVCFVNFSTFTAKEPAIVALFCHVLKRLVLCAPRDEVVMLLISTILKSCGNFLVV